MKKSDIIFDYTKLSDKDKKFYDGLDAKSKEKFESKWKDIEFQKKKIEQTKEQMQRMKSKASKDARKAETRYKIQLGGEVYKVLQENDISLEENQIHLISDFLHDQEERGHYFTKYLNRKLSQPKISAPIKEEADSEMTDQTDLIPDEDDDESYI